MGAIPYIPNPASVFNPSPFDNIINAFGPSVLWLKGHRCPCTGDTGSPLDTCDVCFGKGIYYDPSQGPFKVLITLISWVGRAVDIGEVIDPQFGMTFEGHPIITVSNTYSPILWEQMNTDDAIIEIGTVGRYYATLRVGQNEAIPAWKYLSSVTIAASGAVVVEDPTINQPVSGVPYIVNEATGTVTLQNIPFYPNGWPVGTAYTIELYAPYVWSIAERYGGSQHARPFVNGLTFPKRWKLSLLDLFGRDKWGSSTNIGPPP